MILACTPGSPTGNILNDIQSATADGDTVSVGQQTVPMKVTGFVAEPAIDIEKTCPAEAAFGEDITFSITITNNGNEALDNIVVMDTVDGHAPVDISNLFADTLAPGASETQDFVYSQQPGDPDPITNSVTVTADGVSSNTQVTDTASATPTSRTSRASTSRSPARSRCRSARTSPTRSPSRTRATSRWSASP